MIFKRYADADLVRGATETGARGFDGARASPVALARGGGDSSWRCRWRSLVVAPAKGPNRRRKVSRYNLPHPVTAFAVIGILRRMHTDTSLRWSDTSRAELAQTISTSGDALFRS